MKKVKKLRLKKGIRNMLLIILIWYLIADCIISWDMVSYDEYGNTCYGNIIKACGE